MVQVIKKENESTGAMLRRFSKRVQLSRFVSRARSRRFYVPLGSDYTKKKEALRRVAWEKDMERTRKLGKVE
ncbi:hypothetical protein A3J56_01580 [Candidatus Giovannonibacteria bacterium RIFCSPHIGHO2_02_FULL_46_20]|uniref:30S ribosomal protein S21 n=1 Tax=Candidatus Giovannonibacteria bacterium RIFCSPHIGHO2_02_FULL_46_20 TaxID=1798338 RepID=A0A1F5WGN4_9BACT|nr:MAG: hypothetical protein A3J56_01580 [Candidatus Giovannonibacteria bacterium RIFCSPHIGHO2_02_FULL_46_20]